MKPFLQSITLTVLILLTISLQGQNQTQVVKGLIIDQQSEMPLIGATVQLISNDQPIGTTSDVDGYFRLEGIPVGRHAFQINYLGYRPLTLPNIVVTSGKEVVLNITLEESVEELTEVVVKANTEKDQPLNQMATISARTFSLEEVNRFSGGRSDVARLAGNFAGVATANDSRNDIVIRGNSPTGLLWRLEGVPIPNPNHFATLGTTGGPVSALNPNLLRSSDFMTSAFPAEYGNALSGVFDLGFRSGNRDKHEFMAQLGAITGLEVMAEGPMNKSSNGSYLVAGRYSFIGLASELGLNIGTNATPDYQDIGFKFDFGKTKIGRISVFGIGGLSDIEFLGDETDETDLFSAPDEDARADSRFGVIGLQHNVLLGNQGYIRTVISGSVSENVFSQERYFNKGTTEEVVATYGTADNTESRLALTSYYNQKFSAKLNTRIGLTLENYFYNVESTSADEGPDPNNDGIRDLVTLYEFDDQALLVQPFAQAQYRINDRWTFNAGIHGQYLNLNDTYAVEPRLAINWAVAPKQKLNLGYGLHHQAQPLPVLRLQSLDESGNAQYTNESLEFSRSQHFVLGYDNSFAQDWRAKVEVYYQALDQIPVESTPTSFSLLNTGADFVFPNDKFNLVNDGTGFNQGIELTIEKFYSKGYYVLITGSVFESKYEGSDGIERNTAFNNGYVANLLFGKEWKIGKEKRHALTFDTKVTTAGGRYYTPTDLAASQMAGVEMLNEDEAFTLRYDPYFRWDVKFGIQLNSARKKISHQFYFDIQNVTNRENIFVKRYNRQTNQVNDVFQIGFFPDFMYRVQF